MAPTKYLTDTWDIVKEVDLRPLREQALGGVKIAIVGDDGSGRFALAEQMRRDPARPEMRANSPLLLLDLEDGARAAGVDLIILLMDAQRADSGREQGLVIAWHNANQRVLVFIHETEAPAGVSSAVSPWSRQKGRGVVWGSVEDTDFLTSAFAQAVIDLIPEKLLSLGRFFPLFRVPVARYLINDTCVSNAAYALSTGLAETVAIFDIPIAVADMVILTKNQAYLAYKLGLALGYSTQWQDYVGEFGGVLGSGFVWRELARTLVGLVPVWGLVPKIGIAYAGTYVVGNAVLQWYLTGRHVSKEQLRQFYTQAFTRGKEIARNLIDKAPRPQIKRPRLPRLPRRKTKALPAPQDGPISEGIIQDGGGVEADIVDFAPEGAEAEAIAGSERAKKIKIGRPRLPRRKKKALPEPEKGAISDGDETRQCPQCERLSAVDAGFCQYCGEAFR
jgi:uncharacterized protein (DUF697 family)